MIRHTIRSAPALLALFAGLGLAGPARAQTVPHKESADGALTSSVNPTPQNPLGTQTWVAVGNATHMGKYSQLGSHNFTAPDAQGKGLIVSGRFLSTAADGSTIAGSYAGTYTILGNNLVQYNVTALWQTGTGRLAGVTGRADVVAVLNAVTGKFHYDDAGFWIFP
jgi:hypothetical protein